jgi:hypothetical protein
MMDAYPAPTLEALAIPWHARMPAHYATIAAYAKDAGIKDPVEHFFPADNSLVQERMGLYWACVNLGTLQAPVDPVETAKPSLLRRILAVFGPPA